jgi:ABC-2 type transport system ATP-binding protein
METMIDIQKVSKKYGSIQALQEVSFSIPQQSCFGLLGPNGAGKSTMMKILAGIVVDFAGEMSVHGQSVRTHRADVQRLIGYVPQEISLEQKLSALDNLHFFGRMQGLRGNRLRQRIEEVLETVGLTERRNDVIATYSGGMKRRINIGCALLHQPDILIMDEPTVGVDPQSRNYIFELIRDLKRDGTTILYSSHYMEEIQALCDSLALIDQGKVVETGTIRNIRNRHATPSVYVEAENIDQQVLQPYGTAHQRGNGFVIETAGALQTLHDLSSHLRGQGIEVHRLEMTQSSLEDIFLDLTGSSLRDSA